MVVPHEGRRYDYSPLNYMENTMQVNAVPAAPLVHFRCTSDFHVKELQVDAGALGRWTHYVKVKAEDLINVKIPKLALELAELHGAPQHIIDRLFVEVHRKPKTTEPDHPYLNSFLRRNRK